MQRVLAMLSLGALLALAPAAAMADDNTQGSSHPVTSTPDVTMNTSADETPQLNTTNNIPVYLQQNQQSQ
ncbi:MAG TPA: hypothetical protein VKZ50_17340 [bacterium]|nr:hypothetical protein [bacterium]